MKDDPLNILQAVLIYDPNVPHNEKIVPLAPPS